MLINTLSIITVMLGNINIHYAKQQLTSKVEMMDLFCNFQSVHQTTYLKEHYLMHLRDDYNL